MITSDTSARISLGYVILGALSYHFNHGSSKISDTILGLYQKFPPNPQDTNLLLKIYESSDDFWKSKIEYLIYTTPFLLLQNLISDTELDQKGLDLFYNDLESLWPIDEGNSLGKILEKLAGKEYFKTLQDFFPNEKNRSKIIQDWLKKNPEAVLFPKNKTFYNKTTKFIKTLLNLTEAAAPKYLRERIQVMENWNILREVLVYSEITLEKQLFKEIVDCYTSRTLSYAPLIFPILATWSEFSIDRLMLGVSTIGSMLGFNSGLAHTTWLSQRIHGLVGKAGGWYSPFPSYPKYLITRDQLGDKNGDKAGGYYFVFKDDDKIKAPSSNLPGILKAHLLAPANLEDFRESGIYTNIKHAKRAFSKVEKNSVTKPDLPFPKWERPKRSEWLKTIEMFEAKNFDLTKIDPIEFLVDLRTWKPEEKVQEHHIKIASDTLDNPIEWKRGLAATVWEEQIGKKTRWLCKAEPSETQKVFLVFTRLLQVAIDSLNRKVLGERLSNFMPATWLGAPEQLIKLRDALVYPKVIDLINLDVKNCFPSIKVNSEKFKQQIEISKEYLKAYPEGKLIMQIMEIFFSTPISWNGSIPDKADFLPQGLSVTPYVWIFTVWPVLVEMEKQRQAGKLLEWSACGDDFIAVANGGQSKDVQEAILKPWQDFQDRLGIKYHFFKYIKESTIGCTDKVKQKVIESNGYYSFYPKNTVPIKFAGLIFFKKGVYNLGDDAGESKQIAEEEIRQTATIRAALTRNFNFGVWVDQNLAGKLKNRFPEGECCGVPQASPVQVSPETLCSPKSPIGHIFAPDDLRKEIQLSSNEKVTVNDVIGEYWQRFNDCKGSLERRRVLKEWFLKGIVNGYWRNEKIHIPECIDQICNNEQKNWTYSTKTPAQLLINRLNSAGIRTHFSNLDEIILEKAYLDSCLSGYKTRQASRFRQVSKVLKDPMWFHSSCFYNKFVARNSYLTLSVLPIVSLHYFANQAGLNSIRPNTRIYSVQDIKLPRFKLYWNTNVSEYSEDDLNTLGLDSSFEKPIEESWIVSTGSLGSTYTVDEGLWAVDISIAKDTIDKELKTLDIDKNNVLVSAVQRYLKYSLPKSLANDLCLIYSVPHKEILSLLHSQKEFVKQKMLVSYEL